MCNITLRCVSVAIVVVEKQRVLHICVCTRACVYEPLLIQRATRKLLLRHLWPLWLHHIFRHYLINGTIFEKSY
jgi:hypothetical protein